MTVGARLPVPEHPPEEVRRVVEEVLARPEYAELRPGLLDRVWQAVERGLGALIGMLQAGGAGSVIGTAVLVLVAGALLVAVARFTRRIQRGARVDVPEVSAAGRSSGQWRTLAVEHEDNGRLREAVRCRYRAVIAQLAEAGLVADVPGRTAGEYLAAVRADIPAAAPAFSEATATFEQAWYGRAPVTAEDLAELRAAVEAVQRSVGLDADAGANATPASVSGHP